MGFELIGSPNMALTDAHCHLYEFSESDIAAYAKSFLIAAVSDDLESSRKTLLIAKRFRSVIPCIGVHPWEVGETPISHLAEIAKLIDSHDVHCLGEIGLDKKFSSSTISRQRLFFHEFLRLAKEYQLAVNVHALGAWSEVLSLLRKYDISRAVIHWYTGPTELLNTIKSLGYYIGVNPAIKIQKKMKEVVKAAPLEILLTESDGPYNYRKLKLGPELIRDTIKIIAELKGISEAEVANAIKQNFKSLMKKLGISISLI